MRRWTICKNAYGFWQEVDGPDCVEQEVVPVPDDQALARVLAAVMVTNSPDNRAAVLAALEDQ